MELKRPLGRIIAVSVVVLAGAGYLVWRAHQPLGYAAFGAIAVGFAFAVAVLARTRLTIDVDGLAVGSTTIAWAEVSAYRYWTDTFDVGAAGAIGLVALAARRWSLVVRTADGRSIAIDNRYAGAEAARSRVLDEVHKTLRGRASVAYEPFELGEATLAHRQKGALAFDEIERVGVDAGRIAVRRRGKKLPWSWTSIRAIDNSLLLLEELSARGVTVKGRVQLER